MTRRDCFRLIPALVLAALMPGRAKAAHPVGWRYHRSMTITNHAANEVQTGHFYYNQSVADGEIRLISSHTEPGVFTIVKGFEPSPRWTVNSAKTTFLYFDLTDAKPSLS